MIRIVKQLNTEKTYKLNENNICVFLVPRESRKDKIKKEIEKTFSVKIDSIRTMNMPIKEKSFRGIKGRLTEYKKVYVTVAKGMKIDVNNTVSAENSKKNSDKKKSSSDNK